MDRLLRSHLNWLTFFLCTLLLSTPSMVRGQDIIISEIMPDPDEVTDANGEYVELYNTTSSGISIDSWDIQDANGTITPISEVNVPAKGFVVLCRNTSSGSNGGVTCADEFTASVNNGTETITLRNADDNVVDEVAYELGANGWPDPTGASLECVGAPDGDNNSPSNWQEATTRKGDFAGDNGDFGSPNANATDGELPVELVSFRTTIDEGRALLTWRTASEQGNARFEVQHQGPAASNFRTIGTRKGAGTTTQPQSYQFETDRLVAGTHTFRLKQVDQDGTEHYSDERTAEVQGDAGLRLLGPNPLRRGQTATVVVRVDAPQEVRVVLYNVLGERVRTLTPARARPGRPARLQLRARNLPSGLYLVQARGTSFSTSRRITIVR